MEPGDPRGDSRESVSSEPAAAKKTAY
jgi:hypothetical protein